jgi:hypothetical protein
LGGEVYEKDSCDEKNDPKVKRFDNVGILNLH